MKSKNIILIVIVVIISFYVYSKWKESKEYMRENPSTFEQVTRKNDEPCVTKEFIYVDKTNKFGYTLEGTVNNQCDVPKKGYVKIKFIDSNGDIRHSTMTNVNDGDEFNPKQSAPYDYTAAPDKFVDIKEFEIEFIER